MRWRRSGDVPCRSSSSNRTRRALHTDRGLPVGTFPQVTPHVYVEPVGGGIGKTGVAQAASAGCLDVGANGRVYPFLAFQDLEKGADNDVAVIFDRAFRLHGKAFVTAFPVSSYIFP